MINQNFKTANGRRVPLTDLLGQASTAKAKQPVTQKAWVCPDVRRTPNSTIAEYYPRTETKATGKTLQADQPSPTATCATGRLAKQRKKAAPDGLSKRRRPNLVSEAPFTAEHRYRIAPQKTQQGNEKRPFRALEQTPPPKPRTPQPKPSETARCLRLASCAVACCRARPRKPL